MKDERIRFDEATKNWFKAHPEAVTTVRECVKCGLHYKSSLRHKCKEDKTNEGRT